MQGSTQSIASEAVSLITHVEPLAVPIERTPAMAGVSRTKIFEAVAAKELTARKAGRSTIIEISELRRWIRSLPTRGRESEPAAA